MTQTPGGTQPPQDDRAEQPTTQLPTTESSTTELPTAGVTDQTVAQPWAPQAFNSTEVLDVGGAGHDGDPATGPVQSGGRRRGVLIGAGVLVVALLGGGAALAASKLSGGGAQPDEAVPASAISFVALDLDPSSGQKIDALRFARKFPAAADKIGKDDDLRKAFFESLKKDGDVKGDWAKDVGPWLGDRAGVAVLPATNDGDDPEILVVLAVKDQAKAKAGMAKVSDGKATCEFTSDFAVCAEKSAVAKKAVADAEKSPLSDAKNYSDDMSAIGDKGIAHVWVDLAAVQDAVPTSGALPSSLNGVDLTGRGAFALRFDGPHLELAGQTFGTKLPAKTGTVSVDDLPADSVAAIGLSGADKSLLNAYQSLREAAGQALGGADQFDAQVDAFQQQTGIAIPQDVAKALGGRVSVVFGGADARMPKVAARVSGDRGTLDKILSVVADAGGLELGKAPAGTDTVVASTQAYADEVANGKGLGSSEAFTDAVPNAKDAQAVAYVNIAQFVAQMGDQLDLSADDRKAVAPLSSVGLSVKQDGQNASFTLRLTTK